MKHLTIITCLVFALVAGGCSTLKKVTGQTNDTILPGQREEVIPPEQMTAKDPIVQGQGQSQDDVVCDPAVSVCPSAPQPKTVQ